MLIGYAIIFFVLLVQHVVHAQETGIDCSQASNDWVKCFSTNLGTCSFCFLGVPADNPTCDDYKLAYCPITECCPQCAKEAALYAQCTANSLTDVTKQSTCDLDCSNFVPVENSGSNTDCSQALNKWVKCSTTNLRACSFCFLGVPADNPTCDDYKLAYCPLTECCSQCAEEAAFYAQCTANSWTDATQQSECNLGCSGTGQSSTSDASTTRGILVLTAVIVMEVIGQTTLF